MQAQLPAWAGQLSVTQVRQLIALVRARLDRMHVEVQDIDFSEGVLQLRDPQGTTYQMYLGNLALRCAGSLEESWEGMVEQFTAPLLASLGPASERGSFSPDQLRLQVRAAASYNTGEMASLPVCEGLVKLLVKDEPTAAVGLSLHDLAESGMSAKEAFALAARQTLEELGAGEPEKLEMSGEAIIYAFNSGSIYNSTLVLDLERRLPVPAPAGVLACFPTRELLMAMPVAPQETIRSLMRMAVFADRLAASEAYPISDQVYWVYQGQLAPVAFVKGGVPVMVVPPPLAERMGLDRQGGGLEQGGQSSTIGR